MKFNDILWLGLKGMSERKLRAGLTVLTVVIGIAAIVALIALVSGISTSINKTLSSLGPTTIYLTPKGQSTIFTDADVAELEAFPNVSTVIPLLRFPANVTAGGTSSAVTVYGISNSSLQNAIGGVNLLAGSLYTNAPEPTALVGYSIAFPTTTQSQSSVIINEPIYLTETSGQSSQTITLIPTGILASYGSLFLVSQDTSVFVSIAEAEALQSKYSYNIIIVQAKNTSSVTALYNLLTDVYGSKASVLSVQEISSEVSSVTGSLSLLLGAIAGISLVVAGISILSIMMVSVAERTHEIGILKSIGFKRNDILLLFLSEALIIGVLGGLIGVGIGAGASYLLSSTLGGGSHSNAAPTPAPTATSGRAGGGGGGAVFVGGGAQSSPSSSSSGLSSLSFTPDVSPSLVFIAIFVAVLVSVLATLYPAWKASTIDPIKALRSE